MYSTQDAVAIINGTKYSGRLIPLYNRYFITRSGVVIDRKRKLLVAERVNTTGKSFVIIRRNELGRTPAYELTVSGLLARTYIDNPNDKLNINHMDNDVTNNCLENLEWV